MRAQKAGASALVDVGGVVVEEEDAGGALQVRDRVALAQQLQHHRLPVLDRHAVLVVGPERRRRDDVGVREGAGRDEVHVGANDLAASKRSNGKRGAALLRRGDKGAEGVEVGNVVLPAPWLVELGALAKAWQLSTVWSKSKTMSEVPGVIQTSATEVGSDWAMELDKRPARERRWTAECVATSLDRVV